MKPRYGSFRLARVTWLETGRSTAKTSMCAGSYSSTSRPSITTLAPCAATQRAGPKRGVAGLGRHPRQAHGIGAREPELKGPVVGGVRRDPIGEPSERQCAGRGEGRVLAGCRGGPHESVGAAPRDGTAASACFEDVACADGLAGKVSSSRQWYKQRRRDVCRNLRRRIARSRSIRGGIGKKRLARPGNLIVR